MSVLILMLVILAPEVLRDVRRSSVIMVVLVLCEGLCVIAVKLMDVYLAPVVMAGDAAAYVAECARRHFRHVHHGADCGGA